MYGCSSILFDFGSIEKFEEVKNINIFYLGYVLLQYQIIGLLR